MLGELSGDRSLGWVIVIACDKKKVDWETKSDGYYLHVIHVP